MNPSQLRALIVDDPIEAWNAAGFAGDDVITIGSTTIVTTAASENRGDGHRHGIVGASIEGTGELDGLQLGTWVEGADDPIDLEIFPYCLEPKYL